MKIAGKCGFLLILLIYSTNGFLQPSSRRGGNLHLPMSFMSEMKASTKNEQEATTSSKLSSKKSLDISKIQLNDLEDLEYSRCLSPMEEKKQVLSEGEEYIDKTPIWKKVARKIPRPGRKTKKGALILLRCGQSTFNANQTFTGWMDPPLTDQGIEQCKHVASLFVAEGFEPDVVYTSRLKRAIVTAWTVLETMDALFIPVFKTYRLNQRMYGALQGLSKRETAKEFGSDVVQAWRNSLKARPPPLAREDPNHPSHDRRYADLSEDRIPTSESILDCMERARPLWEYKIRKDIERGKTVLVVAHRDTLRGLAKVIDGLSDDDATNITIPSGVPIVYEFDQDMKVVEPADTGLSQIHTSGTFLEKPGRLKEAFEKHTTWSDLSDIEGGAKKRVHTLEKSLERLRRAEGDLGGAIRKATVISNDEEESVKLKAKESPIAPTERWNDDPSEFEEYDFFADTTEEIIPVNIVSLPVDKTSGDPRPKQEGPFVVLIRHGRTPHNNMGLFTGWEDPPLAEGGIEDAKNAGRLLKRHGFEFDVVYTSWLTRAIQTAYHALAELDCVWIPIVKSWRLNERMYGDLTGKSKKMISHEYGEEQLKKWRRGHTIRPPPTSSYSLSYPGNDLRRAKHFKDLPISWKETINRSLEQRKISIHRKFPKTESLKDCMDRSIPFYTEKIQQEAVDQGKRVLITSHENAIRGILMHLCDIPQEAMSQLHLPNGLPLVYNVKGRCITLLDDGSGDKHDFGPAAKYLFKPCELDEAFFEEMASKQS